VDKVVFIDRDGVINVDPIGDYIKRKEDFRFEKGAIEGLKAFQDAGYQIIIISNQAGIGDGVYPEEALWEIHDYMINELRAQGIFIRSSHYCLHGKNEGCKCRKPETGLFEEAVKDIEMNRTCTFFIGDKASDIEAGKRFGLRTVFCRTGHGSLQEKYVTGDLKPDFIVENLEKAAEVILSCES